MKNVGRCQLKNNEGHSIRVAEGQSGLPGRTFSLAWQALTGEVITFVVNYEFLINFLITSINCLIISIYPTWQAGPFRPAAHRPDSGLTFGNPAGQGGDVLHPLLGQSRLYQLGFGKMVANLADFHFMSSYSSESNISN